MTCCAATSARPTRHRARPPRRGRRPHPARVPATLSRKAARSLEKLGVDPLARHTVVGVDAEAVSIEARDGTTRGRPRPHRDLGRGRHGLEPGAELAGEAGRGRPGRPRAGRARPDAPGPPRGARARRHGARGSRGQGGRCPAWRRSRCSRAATRRGVSGAPARPRPKAVPLRRQGEPRDHRALESRRRREGPPHVRASRRGPCGCSSTSRT